MTTAEQGQVHEPGADASAPKEKRTRRGGITARKGRDGRVQYYARYVDADGKCRNMLVSSTSMADARAELAAIKLRVLKGEAGAPRPKDEEKARAHMTVEELGERFTAEYVSAKIKDIQRYRREVRNILRRRVYPHVGTVRAAQLKTKQIDALIDKLIREGGTDERGRRRQADSPRPKKPVEPKKRGLAGSTARSAVAALSRMFAWGRKTELIDCANPVTGCERPSTNASLEFLSRDEVTKLLDYVLKVTTCYAASDTMRTLYGVVAFCLYTGVRKGEAMGVRWQDLHLDGPNARVDVMRSYNTAPKSGKARHVRLNPEIVCILRAWRDHCPPTDEGVVFPVLGLRGWRMGRREDVLGLGDVYTAAGVKRPKKPWHCLRHTFSSHFVMSGGSILTLQKVLGHSTLTMTQIYAHLHPDHMAGEIDRLSFAAVPAGVLNLDTARRERAGAGAGGHQEAPEANTPPASSTLRK